MNKGFKLCIHSILDFDKTGVKISICPFKCHWEYNKQYLEAENG